MRPPQPVTLRFVRAAPASVTLDFVVPSGKDAIDSLRTSAGVKLTARTQDDVPTRYRHYVHCKKSGS